MKTTNVAVRWAHRGLLSVFALGLLVGSVGMTGPVSAAPFSTSLAVADNDHYDRSGSVLLKEVDFGKFLKLKKKLKKSKKTKTAKHHRSSEYYKRHIATYKTVDGYHVKVFEDTNGYHHFEKFKAY